jgi:hypothetical protein
MKESSRLYIKKIHVIIHAYPKHLWSSCLELLILSTHDQDLS